MALSFMQLLFFKKMRSKELGRPGRMRGAIFALTVVLQYLLKATTKSTYTLARWIDRTSSGQALKAGVFAGKAGCHHYRTWHLLTGTGTA